MDVKERKFWTCHDPVERSERIHLSHPDQTGSITVVLSTTVARSAESEYLKKIAIISYFVYFTCEPQVESRCLWYYIFRPVFRFNQYLWKHLRTTLSVKHSTCEV